MADIPAAPPATNTALAISAHHALSVRRNLPIPTPTENELLVRVLFSGVNPADIKHKVLGIVDTHLGYDFCGLVHATPPQGSGFALGDLVAGTTPTGYGRSTRWGTHQDYLACPIDMAFKVPPNLAPSHAACLCVTTMTAADILFNLCGFELKDLESPSCFSKEKAILIWGASTSVGNACVQFAHALKIPNILVTASASRHELLRSLGATHCFDYTNGDVVSQIKRTVKSNNLHIAYAIDSVGTQGLFSSSATLTRQSCEGSKPPVILVSTIVRPFDKDFKMPTAIKNIRAEARISVIPSLKAVDIFKHRIPSIKKNFEPDPVAHGRLWEGLLWAAKNYGEKFKLPQVQEIDRGSAEMVLAEVDRIARGAAGFGKHVVKHPLTGAQNGTIA